MTLVRFVSTASKTSFCTSKDSLSVTNGSSENSSCTRGRSGAVVTVVVSRRLSGTGDPVKGVVVAGGSVVIGVVVVVEVVPRCVFARVVEAS